MKKSLKKNRLLLFLLVIVLAFAMIAVGCGGGGTPATSGTPTASDDNGDLGPAVNMSLGHLFPTTDYRARTMQQFADLCEEYSGGNITITIYPAQTLVTSQDALKLTAQGVADIGMGALSFSVSEVPAFAPIDLQGIYDPENFWEAFELVKPTLNKILETQNQMCLFMMDETNFVFYLNDKNSRDVHSPADVKGLRLRDSGLWIGKSMMTWGVSPQTVVPADIAVALERGTVDGGYTGWGFVNSYKLFESAKTVTYTEISKNVWSPVAINLDRWNSLSAGQQAIILRAAAEAQEYNKVLVEEDWEIFQANLESVGGTIYYMTHEENQAFISLSMQLLEECREYSGELGNEMIDALLSTPSRFDRGVN